jgi:hypothetical protein
MKTNLKVAYADEIGSQYVQIDKDVASSKRNSELPLHLGLEIPMPVRIIFFLVMTPCSLANYSPPINYIYVEILVKVLGWRGTPSISFCSLVREESFR